MRRQLRPAELAHKESFSGGAVHGIANYPAGVDELKGRAHNLSGLKMSDNSDAPTETMTCAGTVRSEPLIQVSTVPDLTFVPVGFPALARVSLIEKSFRLVKAYIRWNPVSSGFGGASGGFGVRRFS